MFFLPSIFSMLVIVICYLALVNSNVSASVCTIMIHCFQNHMSFCVDFFLFQISEFYVHNIYLLRYLYGNAICLILLSITEQDFILLLLLRT